MGYRRLPFQFTLRQLLGSTVWFCAAFAVTGWAVRLPAWYQPTGLSGLELLLLLIPSVVGAFLGAGIGTLRNQTAEYAARGFIALPVLCLVVPIAFVLIALLVSTIFRI